MQGKQCRLVKMYNLEGLRRATPYQRLKVGPWGQDLCHRARTRGRDSKPIPEPGAHPARLPPPAGFYILYLP